MRVIGGSRKRMPLETIKGMETRPTTDRIKETLFNMLQPEIYQCRFLDLFAGSGQMGIEALSRGAREAVFVEKNPAAARCIKRNLAFTRLEETGRLYTRDVMDFLQHPGGEVNGHGQFRRQVNPESGGHLIAAIAQLHGIGCRIGLRKHSESHESAQGAVFEK